MLRRTAEIRENLRVKTKLFVKPLRHRYFSQTQFACSKSTIETRVKYVRSYRTVNKPERHQWREDSAQSKTPFDVFIVDFEHILHLVLVFLLLTLNKQIWQSCFIFYNIKKRSIIIVSSSFYWKIYISKWIFGLFNGWKLLPTFTKSSISEVQQVPESPTETFCG